MKVELEFKTQRDYDHFIAVVKTALDYMEMSAYEYGVEGLLDDLFMLDSVLHQLREA